MATTFENVNKTYQVALHVCRGVIQRVTHTSLCGKMDDAVDSFPLEQLAQYIRVCDVGFDESKAGLFAKSFRGGFLKSHILKSIDFVYPYYLIPPREQPLGHVHADETCRT